MTALGFKEEEQQQMAPPHQTRTGLGPCRLDRLCLLFAFYEIRAWNNISRSGRRAGRDGTKGKRSRPQRRRYTLAYACSDRIPLTLNSVAQWIEFEEDRRPAS